MVLSQADRVRALAVDTTPQIKQAPFGHRGFSGRVIEALVAAGIDAPERLLFMDGDALNSIPGVGPKGRVELEAYRRRFAS